MRLEKDSTLFVTAARNISTTSKLIFHLLLVLIFTELSQCFFIQEKSTQKYLKSTPRKNVVLVKDINAATDYETEAVAKEPHVFSIHVKESDLVLDYSGGGPVLISWPYHNGYNQHFSITLDYQGYWQILQKVNNSNKFLRYDQSTDTLVGGDFDQTHHSGFLLWADNKKTCYPGSVEHPRDFSFGGYNPFYGSNPFNGSSPFYGSNLFSGSNPFYGYNFNRFPPFF